MQSWAWYLAGCLALVLSGIDNRPEASVGPRVQDRVYSVLAGGVRGNGFFLERPGKETYFITNWHVCAASTNHLVQVGVIGQTLEPGIVVRVSPKQDLCAIRTFNKPGLRMAHLSAVKGDLVKHAAYDSRTLRASTGKITETLVADLPYPYRAGGYCEPGYRYQTRIEADSVTIHECINRLTLTDTDIVGVHGMSGSPLVNIRGEVVGVVVGTNGNPGPIFILPLFTLSSFMESL